MSQKELTVKVGFLLGNADAFQKAAALSDKMSRDLKQGGTQATEAVGKSVEVADVKLSDLAKKHGAQGDKKGFVKTITEGLGSVAGGFGLMKLLGGVGAASAFGGLFASDLAMLGGGGPGLRGHGISGMVTGFGDMLSGRKTREAMEDFQLQQVEFRTKQLATRLEGSFQRAGLVRDAALAPVTESDPLRRQHIERERFRQRRGLLDADQVGAELGIADDIGDWKRRRDRLGPGPHGDFALEAEGLNLAIQRSSSRQRFLGAKRDLAQEELSTFAEQVQQKKDTVRGSALSFGAMTSMQAHFLQTAAGRLKAGQMLMPQEVAALSGSGIAKNELDQYLLKRAKRMGFNEYAEGIADKDTRGAGGNLQVGVDGRVDIKVSLEKQMNRVYDETKKVVAELSEQMRKLEKEQQALEATLHQQLNVNRQVQVPGR